MVSTQVTQIPSLRHQNIVLHCWQSNLYSLHSNECNSTPYLDYIEVDYLSTRHEQIVLLTIEWYWHWLFCSIDIHDWIWTGDFGINDIETCQLSFTINNIEGKTIDPCLVKISIWPINHHEPLEKHWQLPQDLPLLMSAVHIYG